MTLLKEQSNASISWSSILIILGIIGLLIGIETCNEITDEGQLTSKKVTIQKRPRLIKGTKSIPEHYRIFTNEYLSPFWISGTALSIIKNNESLELGVQQMQVDDTLEVIFQTNRQNLLDNPENPVEVFGLTDSKREYISPGVISGRKRKTSKTLFFCSSALLLTILILKAKKLAAKINTPFQT